MHENKKFSNPFEELNVKLDKVISLLEMFNGTGQTPHQAPSLSDWLTEGETQALLSKKATALWTMRTKGILISTKIGGKVYYNRPQIMELMAQNQQKAFKS